MPITTPQTTTITCNLTDCPAIDKHTDTCTKAYVTIGVHGCVYYQGLRLVASLPASKNMEDA